MSEEVKSYADEKASKPNETQILIFIGSSSAVQHYRERIEALRKKGMTVWVIVNEEVSPRLRTPVWTYVGEAELNRFLGGP